MKLNTLSAALVVALGCGMAVAQTPPPNAPAAGTGSSVTGGRAAPAAQPGTGTRNAETNKDDHLSRSDRKFIEEAAGGGMFEVQAAQLAAAKATDPNVKSFAGKLVDDHQQANNDLVQLANAKKVELPAAPPRGKRHEIEKLAKKSGAAFDKAFVEQVGVKDHEKDIRKFEKAAGKVKDPDLRAWVEKTLPHLREHLAMAQQLSGKGGGEAASMGHRGVVTTPHAPDIGTATPKGAATGTNTGGKTGS